MNYKGILIVIMIMSMTVFVTKAQGQDQKVIVAGKTALLFQVAENISFKSFDGAMLSLKEQLSESKAWRLGVSMNAFHTEGEELDYRDSLFSVVNSDESQISLSISFSYQHYINTESAIRFYYGYGVRVNYNHYWKNGFQIGERLGDYVAGGLIGFVGAEWFITNYLSMSGEFCSFLYYEIGFRKYLVQGNKEIKLKSHSIGIANDKVRLGVSLYF